MESKIATIYFDGLCIACSTEINHYRKQKGAEKFLFIDITSAEFIPEEHGIDPKQAHRLMHVRDTQGELKQGVDAFRAIWIELPKYHFLYSLTRFKFVRWILEIGYNLFIKIRPYLPRRKADCSASPYCEIKKD